MTSTDVVADAAAPAARSNRVRRTLSRLTPARAIDLGLAAALGALTFVAHSVGYVLSAPFFIDESWVAVSTKVDLRAVRHITAVTPLGWTLLLRTMVFGGQQRLRLLPLIFSGLTVAVAYLLVRSLPWRSVGWARVSAVLGGVAVLMTPSSLLRNDLKQYTADAFVTLTVLLLIARLEREWTRRRLVLVGVAGVLGFAVSAVSLFVTAAGFAAIVLSRLVARDLRRAAEAAAVGLVSGLLLGALLAAIYAPNLTGRLTDYWRNYYLPVHQGWHASLHYLHDRGVQMAQYLGMGPLLVAVALTLSGVVTLALSKRPALALAGPLLLVEMVIMGAAKKYPLFDQRTSHFLTAMFAVYAAVGVAGLGSLIARRQVVVAAAAVALVGAQFVHLNWGDLRRHSIPAEDPRSPTAYVAAHRAPGDVVLVSSAASEGFSYYWPIGRPVPRPNTVSATRFQTWFPAQPDIVVASDRTRPAIQAALSQAAALAQHTAGARIWLVRVHVTAAEQRSWVNLISLDGLAVQEVLPCRLTTVRVLPRGERQSVSAATIQLGKQC